MNFKMILNLLGKFMIAEAILMMLPLLVSVLYGEAQGWSFLWTIAILIVLGALLGIRKPQNSDIFAKEGLAIVGLAWLTLSLFGALPFYISGSIPRYIDCFFETVSGFTTTGATILSDIEVLPKGILFWRAFTQWIGGMGVLVFMFAVMPRSKTYSMHLMRAEVPGPSVGKLVSKMSINARILYAIYLGLTVLEMIFLLAGGLSFYDAITHAFTTGGTGGFSSYNASIAHFDSTYIEGVITVFMILFGVNFNMFYLLLIGRVRDIFKNEELRWYFGIIAVSIAIITINISSMYGSLSEAFRDSAFHVASLMSTTGFGTANFDAWPTLSKTVLVMLMFVGGCVGSTGGGMKVTRIMILAKTAVGEVRKVLLPHSVNTVKIDRKTVDKTVSGGVVNFFVVYMLMLAASVFIVSFDSIGVVESFTSVVTCINNVGPGLGTVGPVSNFSALSDLSKIVLSVNMLAGRLELYPVLILLSPRVWKK